MSDKRVFTGVVYHRPPLVQSSDTDVTAMQFQKAQSQWPGTTMNLGHTSVVVGKVVEGVTRHGDGSQLVRFTMDKSDVADAVMEMMTTGDLPDLSLAHTPMRDGTITINHVGIVPKGGRELTHILDAAGYTGDSKQYPYKQILAHEGPDGGAQEVVYGRLVSMGNRADAEFGGRDPDNCIKAPRVPATTHATMSSEANDVTMTKTGDGDADMKDAQPAAHTKAEAVSDPKVRHVSDPQNAPASSTADRTAHGTKRKADGQAEVDGQQTTKRQRVATVAEQISELRMDLEEVQKSNMSKERKEAMANRILARIRKVHDKQEQLKKEIYNRKLNVSKYITDVLGSDNPQEAEKRAAARDRLMSVINDGDVDHLNTIVTGFQSKIDGLQKQLEDRQRPPPMTPEMAARFQLADQLIKGNSMKLPPQPSMYRPPSAGVGRGQAQSPPAVAMPLSNVSGWSGGSMLRGAQPARAMVKASAATLQSAGPVDMVQYMSKFVRERASTAKMSDYRGIYGDNARFLGTVWN
jgi:hypothetical protein